MAFRLSCIFALVAGLLLASAPAQADPAQTRAELFAALAVARSEPEAREIEDKIWRLWLTAPDEESQRLLDESIVVHRRLDHRGALTALAKLTDRAPGYAEGWNQRAIVLFLMAAYDESLEAIERTLALEPKHFGALAGKGVILLQQGRDELSQEALRRALAINPWLKERSLIKALPERRI